MPKGKGVIYILTNPSFPQYVKIGYADDIEKRLDQLNRSECVPFAFRLHAYYEVADRLTDIKLHSLIDKLNPGLRTIEEFHGKKRVREFYAMDAEDAYSILETISEINGLKDNLVLVKPTNDEIHDEKEAGEIVELVSNRHHFKEVDFTSSLTGKVYHGETRNDGTLCIIEKESGAEVPNNSKPSKKAILGRALIDLGYETAKDETLYQRYHRLSKIILEKGENPNKQ